MYAYLHYLFSLKKHRCPERTPIFYRFRLVPCNLQLEVIAKFSSLALSFWISTPCERFSGSREGVHPVHPNAPWKDSENATNAPGFRLWVHLGCSLGEGGVHLYQSRSQHFRIHRNKLPVVRMLSAFYVLGVVLHLCLIAGQLFLAVGGNTSIGGHSLGTSRRRWHARQYSCSRRDHRYRPWSVQNRLYSVCFAHCATHSLLLWCWARVFSAAFFRLSVFQLSLRE